MGLAGQDAPEPRGDVGVVVEAEHRIGLGQAGGEVGAVPLGQAAHRDDRLGAAGLLEVGRLEQRVDGVLLGLLDEPAGVDDHGVRVGRVVDEREPARRQPPGELLGVDLVAGAAQGHQGDGRGHRASSMPRGSTRCRNPRSAGDPDGERRQRHADQRCQGARGVTRSCVAVGATVQSWGRTPARARAAAIRSRTSGTSSMSRPSTVKHSRPTLGTCPRDRRRVDDVRRPGGRRRCTRRGYLCRDPSGRVADQPAAAVEHGRDCREAAPTRHPSPRSAGAWSPSATTSRPPRRRAHRGPAASRAPRGEFVRTARMPPIVTSLAAAAMSAATTASRSSSVRNISSNSAASGRRQRTPHRTTTSRWSTARARP